MVLDWMTRMRVPEQEHILGDNEFVFENSKLEMPIGYLKSSVVLFY